MILKAHTLQILLKITHDSVVKYISVHLKLSRSLFAPKVLKRCMSTRMYTKLAPRTQIGMQMYKYQCSTYSSSEDISKKNG